MNGATAEPCESTISAPSSNMAMHTAVNAIREGGYDLLEKPFPSSELVETTSKFLREKPVVKYSDAFSLRDSMDQTLRLYQSALGQKDR